MEEHLTEAQMIARMKETFYKMDRYEESKGIRRMYKLTSDWERRHKVGIETSYDNPALWCEKCGTEVIEKVGELCKDCKEKKEE